MKEKAPFIEPLLEKTEAYGKTTFELIKLKLLKRTVLVASSFITRSIAVLFFLMSLLIASIGISIWLGDKLGNPVYGFYSIAGFYCVLGVVIYFVFNKRINTSIGNSMIASFLDADSTS